jgi:hypothetical protein
MALERKYKQEGPHLCSHETLFAYLWRLFTRCVHLCSHATIFVHISRIFPRSNYPLSLEREVQTVRRPRALLELHFSTATWDTKAFPRSLWILSHPLV